MTTLSSAASEIDEVHPFPRAVKGDDLRAFHEDPLPDGSGSRYVILRAKRYLDERQRDLVARGLVTLEDFYPDVRWMNRIPSEGTLWLYAVESIEVELQHHDNQLIFDDNARNFSEQVFDSFDDAMRYCQDRFGLGPGDFKRSSETNYPQR